MQQLITPHQTLIESFPDLATAEAAKSALCQANFPEDRLIISSQALQPGLSVKDTEAGRSAGGGAMAGAVFGSMAGILLGFMSAISPNVPQMDSVQAVVATALLGSGIGAAAGSLMGALSGSAVSKAAVEPENAAHYVILMEQTTQEEVERAKQVLQPFGNEG